MAAQCTQLHTPHRALAYDALVRGVSLVRFGSSLFAICDGEAEVVRFRAPWRSQFQLQYRRSRLRTMSAVAKSGIMPAARGADMITNRTNGGF